MQFKTMLTIELDVYKMPAVAEVCAVLVPLGLR